MDRVRTCVLNLAFDALYSYLAGLHEATGLLAYGPAWRERRCALADNLLPGSTLDVGCGDGRLLAYVTARGRVVFGLEPSPQMVSRAHRRGCTVVRARAQAMPIQSGAISTVLISYPGPWIRDSRTWDECARVMHAGAEIRVLLGGTTTHGRGHRVRSMLQHVVYGRAPEYLEYATLPFLGHTRISGGYEWVTDQWGKALYWRGVRQG